MNEHLINKAADWFDDIEKWRSFLELWADKNAIEVRWMEKATEPLRNHFAESLSPEWDFKAWGCASDTWWYLREFGEDSIGIGFGWKYMLCFGARGSAINRVNLNNRLKEPKYQPLFTAFGEVHDRGPYDFALVQYRGFAFGSPLDGRLSESEFAWYAAHKKEAFLQQAVAKIETFTKNPENTRLLSELNKEALSVVAHPGTSKTS